jgi:putative ABC transport system permease protein
MLKNYLLTAIRNNFRNPLYLAINLGGLAVGITCFLLIMLYIRHEVSYDKFHTKVDRIYRLNYDVVMGETQTVSPSVPGFVAPHLKREFPEIEEAVRFLDSFSPRTVQFEDKMFDEVKFAWADSGFFRVFDFRILVGDKQNPLSRPNTVVITQSTAARYFGQTDPVGKGLLYNNSKTLEITAVMEDVPATSHFTFDFLTSMSSLEGVSDRIVWNNPNYTTFLLVQKNASVSELQSKIDKWVHPDGPPIGNSMNLVLEPLAHVHFNTDVFNFGGKLVITDKRYLFVFGGIGMLILLAACINYINLSTARASMRAKEVGMRKTIGATFSQLMAQFLSESFLIMVPAIGLALLLTTFFLPGLNLLVRKSIDVNWLDPSIGGLLIAGALALSLLSGFYPALVLSRFKPVSILKSNATMGTGTFLRKSLVVLQFTVSLMLIISTLVIAAQVKYMQSRKLGLTKESVVLIRGNADLKPKLAVFVNDLKSAPGVLNVTRTWRSPFETVVGNGFNLSENPGEEGWVVVGGIAADEHYIETLNMKLVAGRTFTEAHAQDSLREFIVNEAFLTEFGLTTEEALGKKSVLGMTGLGIIVGIVEDFNFKSLHSKVEPIVMFNQPDFFNAVLVKLAAGTDVPSALREINTKWSALVPQRPFNYTFLDDQYDALYNVEARVSTLVLLFSIVAIAIACLGLLGLSSFSTLQRAREISIRKVLGATARNIVMLFSAGYFRLVLISCLIAVPLNYYLLEKWLNNFAYKITISPFYYITGVVLMVILAGITIGGQSYRAAIANPVDNLKRE